MNNCWAVTQKAKRRCSNCDGNCEYVDWDRVRVNAQLMGKLGEDEEAIRDNIEKNIKDERGSLPKGKVRLPDA